MIILSGPKAGMYRLQEIRRRELQRELERRIEIAKAIEKEKITIKEKEAELEALNKSISLEQEFLHRENLLKAREIEIHDLSKKLEKNTDQGVKLVKKIDREKLNLENFKEIVSMEDELDIKLKNFQTMESTDDINNSLERKEKNKSIEFASDSSSHKHVNLMFGKSNIEIVEEQTRISEVLNKEYKQLNNLIDSYLLNALASSKDELLKFKKSLDDIINDDRFDSNYKLGQLKARKEAFLLTKDKYDSEEKYFQERKASFNNLYAEYQALINLLNEESEEFTIDSIDLLEKKVEEKKEVLSKENETRYISESINEVMEDLGYDIVASDYMETAKSNIFHNIYDFGNKNVLSVYTSDNGSLMFEVSGIKEKEELSARDKLRIKEGMDKFCPQYQKIKDALAEKGISINNENLLPADVKFAKAIDLESKNTKSQKVKRQLRRNSTSKSKYKML